MLMPGERGSMVIELAVNLCQIEMALRIDANIEVREISSKIFWARKAWSVHSIRTAIISIIHSR